MLLNIFNEAKTLILETEFSEDGFHSHYDQLVREPLGLLSRHVSDVKLQFKVIVWVCTRVQLWWRERDQISFAGCVKR